jgi:hypothetical protein
MLLLYHLFSTTVFLVEHCIAINVSIYRVKGLGLIKNNIWIYELLTIIFAKEHVIAIPLE